MNTTIDLYEAIKQMRGLTARNKFFSFTHATYNRDNNTGTGMRKVEKALLRPAASEDDVVDADSKLFYRDELLKENRVCWQPLITEFNGVKVKLN
jgi:hypothetical protein